MAPMVERREHSRKYSDRSVSPVTNRHSPHRRSSPRRERSPVHHRGSPRMRSLQRTSSSHKERYPTKEKLPDRARSPKQSRQRSPVRTSSSRSPSPRTKRLKRAQAEREEEKIMDRERGRSSGREERSKGRQREHGEKDRTSSPSLSPRSKRLMRAQAERGAVKIVEQEHGRDSRREERNKEKHGEHGDSRDAPSDRRPVWEKIDGHSSRSSRHDRSVSPEERSHRSKHGSYSPPRVSRAGARDEAAKPRAANQLSDEDLDSVAKMKAAEESLEAKDKDKQKPSFELSGKLAEETNRVRGVTLLFNEPADARKPDIRWRLYVFKAGEVLNEPLYVHRQSCYLFGRERRVADIPTDHPSCSKQHAVIQYRLVEKEKPDGLLAKQVRPYLMDLGSTNGTFINDNRIEAHRYYELIEKDTIRFGNSSREYVILHENSSG
ncbi:FHA domain-containing protein DDL isoform X2 [Iris pallida]|uniref:FHA domain-containing protein DDL isoform X2 n=1 Tax=Iris pallida TaxID=29817 RepID=A0AAX6HJX3_IRIPA|nr:FHA domain-containing protein DDL isoform X2 [Iris pallida]KAJ6841042.1 FHA domain-containing protein DDL isoform X2 [Iris pallida]